ncbi:MAG: hypothetical protein AAF635_05600 [Cyanobacteria bacterium P01_C01_bin.69]
MAKIITHQTWKQRIKRASCHSITLAMCIVTALTILLTAPAASLAAIQSPAQSPALLAALQTTPFKEQPATLTSPREGAAIPLYIRPAPNQQPVGYGISGDPVTITDQFGDYLMEDDPSATWSHIRLNNAPYTEGWLRGRFLLPKTQEE